MQEMWVQSLGWEDSLEEEMATHSNILAWEIPKTEEPGSLQSMRLQKKWTQLNTRACVKHLYPLFPSLCLKHFSSLFLPLTVALLSDLSLNIISCDKSS